MSAPDPIGESMVDRYRQLYEDGQRRGLSGAELPSFALINLVLEFAFLSEPERQLQTVTADRVESRRRIPQSQ